MVGLKRYEMGQRALIGAPADAVALVAGNNFSLILYFYSCFSLYFECHNVKILQQQLQALLETLSATEPHYVRCVKPNNLLKPAIFENSNVIQQLRCGVS